MNHDATQKHIKGFEALSLKTYPDSLGVPTVGWGFNLDKEGAPARVQTLGLSHARVLAGKQTLTIDQADALFLIDYQDAAYEAEKLIPNFDEHPEPVQTVIVDMVFNLGMTRFRKFTKLLAALAAKDYCAAALEMEDSLWYSQVKRRAVIDVRIVRQYCAGENKEVV